MKFSELAKYLQKLEKTSKRLEITSILADLIKKLPQDCTDKGLYLSLGYLRAEYATEKLNIAEKMMSSIFSAAYGKSKKEIKTLLAKHGDLGDVALEIAPKIRGDGLDIISVHTKLIEIAQESGTGSQERKISKTCELLKKVVPLSAKYIVRIILGITRLGFTELTVIEGLVKYLKGEKNKEIKAKIEEKYRIHPDIGLIAKQIKKHGLNGIKDIDMEIGIPVHAQKAQRLGSPNEIIQKMGPIWVEYKFDGTRVQLHMDKNKKKPKDSQPQQGMFEIRGKSVFIKTFTRNLEETTHQYPEIVESAIKQVDVSSVILDGEAIGYNKTTGEFLPFQETMQRKRKHGVSDMMNQIPLKYFVFDILYLNGRTLVDKPLKERRKLLDSIIKGKGAIEIDSHIETQSEEKLSKFAKDAMKKGLEGIMAKKPDSKYEAGARAFSWVKLKKTEDQILSDTVDCVVLGYFHGRGVRASFGIGGFLVGIWDNTKNEYKTITKIGTGLKDDDWRILKQRADKIKTAAKPKNSKINKKFDCDVWIKPKIVVEVGADEISKSSEHTAGFALRFPRLIKFRDDKGSKDTTSPKEIERMYKSQKHASI